MKRNHQNVPAISGKKLPPRRRSARLEVALAPAPSNVATESKPASTRRKKARSGTRTRDALLVARAAESQRGFQQARNFLWRPQQVEEPSRQQSQPAPTRIANGVRAIARAFLAAGEIQAPHPPPETEAQRLAREKAEHEARQVQEPGPRRAPELGEL